VDHISFSFFFFRLWLVGVGQVQWHALTMPKSGNAQYSTAGVTLSIIETCFPSHSSPSFPLLPFPFPFHSHLSPPRSDPNSARGFVSAVSSPSRICIFGIFWAHKTCTFSTIYIFCLVHIHDPARVGLLTSVNLKFQLKDKISKRFFNTHIICRRRNSR